MEKWRDYRFSDGGKAEERKKSEEEADCSIDSNSRDADSALNTPALELGGREKE